MAAVTQGQNAFSLPSFLYWAGPPALIPFTHHSCFPERGWMRDAQPQKRWSILCGLLPSFTAFWFPTFGEPASLSCSEPFQPSLYPKKFIPTPHFPTCSILWKEKKRIWTQTLVPLPVCPRVS